MKLVSPDFLQTINVGTWHREKVLCSLFEGEELVSIVMIKKKMKFDDACDYISQLCYAKEAPEATDAEKVIMHRVAEQFLEDWRKAGNNGAPNE